MIAQIVLRVEGRNVADNSYYNKGKVQAIKEGSAAEKT